MWRGLFSSLIKIEFPVVKRRGLTSSFRFFDNEFFITKLRLLDLVLLISESFYSLNYEDRGDALCKLLLSLSTILALNVLPNCFLSYF